MREPRTLKIGQLLAGDSTYIIPRYQRAYDWKSESQLSDFIDDLFASFDAEDNDRLYLGPVIFFAEDIDDTEVEVIDGQQRITTLVILMVALRDYARKVLEDEALALTLQQHVSNSDALSMPDDDDEKFRHRLKPSPVIEDILPVMSEYSWDGKFPARITKDGKQVGIKRQVNRVKPIYTFCLEQISEKIGDDTQRFKLFAKHLRNKVFLISIVIEDRAEAFEIFERTNARGKGLEVADLLKNFIFSKEDSLAEKPDELWDEIIDSFGSSPLKALKQFWISRSGKVNSRDLYRRLRLYAEQLGINEFLDELRNFASFYRAYHSSDPEVQQAWLIGIGYPKEKMLVEEFRRSVGVLKLFSITQAIPLIFSVMRAFELSNASKKEAKQVLSLLRTLEYFHFANNKVGGRIGNESENAYSQYSAKIFKSGDFKHLTTVRDWFRSAILSQEEFAASFVTLSYDNKSERNIIRYIFDRIVNEGVKDGQSIDLLDLKSAQAGVRSSYDIEHLLPHSHAEDQDELDRYHSIGNLIVIPKQINGILSDKTFPEKMAILRKPFEHESNIKNVPSYLQEFEALHGDKNWNFEAIEDRASDLATESYQIARNQAGYK